MVRGSPEHSPSYPRHETRLEPLSNANENPKSILYVGTLAKGEEERDELKERDDEKRPRKEELRGLCPSSSIPSISRSSPDLYNMSKYRCGKTSVELSRVVETSGRDEDDIECFSTKPALQNTLSIVTTSETGDTRYSRLSHHENTQIDANAGAPRSCLA